MRALLTTIGTTLVSWGPAGILLLAAIDSAGIPMIAGVDALLLVVAAVNPPAAYWSALLASAGSLCGSLFLFYVARKGGERYLDRFTSSGHGARFRRWFLRYGLVTVFVPAFLPIPLPVKVFVLSSGALGVRTLSFALVVLAARIPRYFGLAYLGVELGRDAGTYLKEHAWHMLAVAAAICVFLFVLIRISERFRQSRSTP